MAIQTTYTRDNQRIVVNYHYVEDPSEDFSGIHPCSIAHFDQQIRFLSSAYRTVSLKDMAEALRKGSNERLCAITFDDGLRDQYEYAVPILEKYQAPGTFFIISGTLENMIPSAHIVHVLLSNATANTLVDESNHFFTQYHKNQPPFLIPKDKRITDKRKLRDDIQTANFKETINRLDDAIRDALLKHLVEKLLPHGYSIGSRLFMSEAMIYDLHARGHEIGCHGHNHYAFDEQQESVVRDDLYRSKQRLEHIITHPVTGLSYPHGGHNEMVERVAREAGFTHGVLIKRCFVRTDDSPLCMPRYDTKDIHEYLMRQQ